MPDKSLPIKIVSVMRIYFRQLAPKHRIFADSIVCHTPNLVTIIPPIKDPIAIPSVP
jgi:hypothetical protein